MKKETTSRKVTLAIDVWVWQKVCRVAESLKVTPEEAAIFLLKKVQPTYKAKEEIFFSTSSNHPLGLKRWQKQEVK